MMLLLYITVRGAVYTTYSNTGYQGTKQNNEPSFVVTETKPVKRKYSAPTIDKYGLDYYLIVFTRRDTYVACLVSGTRSR